MQKEDRLFTADPLHSGRKKFRRSEKNFYIYTNIIY